MKYFVAILLIAAALAGCKKDDETAAAEPGAASAQLPPGQAGGTGGIAPMTTTPIPNAPITGTDSVLGAGGGGAGVGQVMKGRARDMAAGGAPSSVDQMPTGEEDPGPDDDGGQ